mgnify:CR=1 FL=1
MIGGLVITPGPSTLLAFVVAATSPVKQSYRLMLGVLLAILLLTAVTSLLSYISYLVSPIFLRMLKAVSLFFIFYIGVKMLISYKKAPDPDKNKSTNSPFANGFAISFFNAKPLAFYLSFLPGIAQTSERSCTSPPRTAGRSHDETQASTYGASVSGMAGSRRSSCLSSRRRFTCWKGRRSSHGMSDLIVCTPRAKELSRVAASRETRQSMRVSQGSSRRGGIGLQ